MASSPPRPRRSFSAADQANAVPKVALTREHAARALDMSLDSFERHVQDEIRLIRRGRLRLVPASELARWVRENAETPEAWAADVLGEEAAE